MSRALDVLKRFPARLETENGEESLDSWALRVEKWYSLLRDSFNKEANDGLAPQASTTAEVSLPVRRDETADYVENVARALFPDSRSQITDAQVDGFLIALVSPKSKRAPNGDAAWLAFRERVRYALATAYGVEEEQT